jgi:regulation of enolase protein 1 (concanavalin A-like superfamily)
VPQHTIEGGAISITPTPNLDYWSRTFYQPVLLKHDAQTLLTPVAADAETTLTTAFTLQPRAQFDQAGIMVLVDEGTWVKAGIEYTDGQPRLSCVVTNDGFSDWSTQLWPDWDATQRTTSIRVRVSKLLPGPAQGPALVYEAAPWAEGDTADSSAQWVQIRISSLRSGQQAWRMGLFAISPIAAAGCEVRFHHIQLGDKQKPVHHTDAGLPSTKLEL